MVDPRDRWIEKHEETDGHYACFAGFEEEIKNCKYEELTEAYNRLNIHEQIALFGFVHDLLEEMNPNPEGS